MANAKNSKIIVIALTIIALSLVGTTLAAITVNQNLTSTGSIATTANIGVYSDAACTNPLTNINWGSRSAGNTATQTVYVKNTGTSSLTLTLATTNWNPTVASNYITVSWNRQGTLLTAGQSTTATITLTVSQSITGVTTFSNTITISGTG